VHSGWSRASALTFNLLSAATFPVGALIAYGLSGSLDVAFLVPFAAGNFLYIGAADLLPELTRPASTREQWLLTGAFLTGVGLLLVLALAE